MKKLKSESGEEKYRRDKGVILFSPRDRYCLEWIADQYAARLDQIQRLLSRRPMGQVKDERRGLAPTTVKDQIERWRNAGWIEYQRVLVGQPGWAWITRKGLQTIGWEDLYTARQPAHTRLNHIYAVNEVRMAADGRPDLTWKSERRYRSELEKVEKGETSGPIPDALVTGEKGNVYAVEVELTQKKPADLERKLEALASAFNERDRFRFSVIWVYVPDEKVKAAVERAREALIERDRKRVDVSVFAGMVA